MQNKVIDIVYSASNNDGICTQTPGKKCTAPIDSTWMNSGTIPLCTGLADRRGGRGGKQKTIKENSEEI